MKTVKQSFWGLVFWLYFNRVFYVSVFLAIIAAAPAVYLYENMGDIALIPSCIILLSMLPLMILWRRRIIEQGFLNDLQKKLAEKAGLVF